MQWREYSCGKQCSDVLHIDESSWNTPPVFETVGNWACIAFTAFCENMMYLFWKVRQFSAVFLLWKYYSNEADRDKRLRLTVQVIFLKVAVRITEEKTGMIIATMRTMVVMMTVIMARHSFSGAFERLLGMCLPLKMLFSHHFSSCRFLSTVHSLCSSSSASLLLCFPVWHSYYILPRCFKIHSFFQSLQQ